MSTKNVLKDDSMPWRKQKLQNDVFLLSFLPPSCTDVIDLLLRLVLNHCPAFASSLRSFFVVGVTLVGEAGAWTMEDFHVVIENLLQGVQIGALYRWCYGWFVGIFDTAVSVGVLVTPYCWLNLIAIFHKSNSIKHLRRCNGGSMHVLGCVSLCLVC